MKFKQPFLLLSFLLFLSGYSQDTTNIKVYKKLADELLKKEGHVKVGEFSLFDSTRVYLIKRKKNEKYKILSANIEVKEGLMKDILVRVKIDEKIIDFRNNYPISLIKYNQRFFKWKLYDREKNYIMIKDAVNYDYIMGENFISDAENIELSNVDTSKQKSDLQVNYSLNSLIDFRIYSDFLGLINETANGIINFEAKSKIYINYANYYNTHFLKTVSPFVKYSRFDNDDRKVKVDTTSGVIARPLDLVQKRYLELGIDFNILEFTFSKNAFYKAHIPIRFGYGLVEVDSPNKENSISTGVYTYGTGIEVDFKRLNNFGLKIGISHDWFRQKSDDSDLFKRNEGFRTIGTNAELYFYNTNKKNSALFLRLEYKELLAGLNGNFASVQFGYKTDLNLSKNN